MTKNCVICDKCKKEIKGRYLRIHTNVVLHESSRPKIALTSGEDNSKDVCVECYERFTDAYDIFWC